MPPEDQIQYSALTGQALYYMGRTALKHKILAVAEEAGVAEASYALKLLQSDGVLRIASAGQGHRNRPQPDAGVRSRGPGGGPAGDHSRIARPGASKPVPDTATGRRPGTRPRRSTPASGRPTRPTAARHWPIAKRSGSGTRTPSGCSRPTRCSSRRPTL